MPSFLEVVCPKIGPYSCESLDACTSHHVCFSLDVCFVTASLESFWPRTGQPIHFEPITTSSSPTVLPLGNSEFPFGSFFPALDNRGKHIWLSSRSNAPSVSDVSRIVSELRQKKGQNRTLRLDPHLVSCLVFALCHSPSFRRSFAIYVRKTLGWKPLDTIVLRIILDWPCFLKIDYAWERRIWTICMWNEVLKEHFAWLSTLGGAFSALGKIGFDAFARKAEKISIAQLRLSYYLGDPILCCRSRIYVALSLIQQRNFRWAKRILRQEIVFIKTELVASEADRLDSILRSVWMYMLGEKRELRTEEEKLRLKIRSEKLEFHEETIRSKKSLVDTIFAISALPPPSI